MALRGKTIVGLALVSLAASVSLATLATLGCDADPAAPSDEGCSKDPRVMAYHDGMKLAGAGGALSFELVQSEPGPPIVGQNQWTVAVSDASGGAIADADVQATPWMPDHGHGTSAVPVITPSGSDVVISPLYFFMPGIWQVTLAATSARGSDSAVFTFCVE